MIRQHAPILFVFLFLHSVGMAQYPGWQQAVDYSMDIALDTAKHQYDGSMKVTLKNNSPDDLTKAYFHLFFNAFQPGSMMDVRSRNISDPDRRSALEFLNYPKMNGAGLKSPRSTSTANRSNFLMMVHCSM